MLALKGSSAQEELDADRALLRRLGAGRRGRDVRRDVVSPATIVVRVTLGAKPARRERAAAKGSGKRSARRRPR